MFKLPEPPMPSREQIEKDFQEMLERQMRDAAKFVSMVLEKQTALIRHQS